MQLKQCLAHSRCSLKHTIVITIIITAVVHWYLLSMANTLTRVGSSQANYSKLERVFPETNHVHLQKQQ